VPAGDRCSGQCCQAFYLPWTHEQFQAVITGEAPLPQTHDWSEIHMILSMVRPLPDEGPDWYTCILFDGQNCTAYDARPQMCRDYPYGRRCGHGKLCTWSAGRSGAHPERLRDRVRLPVLG
jgi:Fe-S-cluster containining protein